MAHRLVVILTLLLALPGIIHHVHKRRRAIRTEKINRAEDELHPLLKDHTKFVSYTTKHATYPSIRTFYRPHAHSQKQPELSSLPLLVFLHGLGGVLPQFAPVLGSLTNIAPCFGLELPGHGRSTFEPKDYKAYTTEAFVALWRVAIEDVCAKNNHKQVVLVGHSMGCSFAALLASTTSYTQILEIPVVGVIAICPRARTTSPKEVKSVQRFFALPNLLIDLLRYFDRRGGENSTSVRRVVGPSSDSDLKRLQYGWNRQYRTAVLKRVTLGLLPKQDTHGKISGGYPDESVWKGIETSMFLVSGECDTVTPPGEVDIIVRYITGKSISEHPKPTEPEDPLQASANGLVPITIQLHNSDTATQPILQAITLPPPAAHALLYSHSTYRLVSALAESFLTLHVSPRLDFSYQLQILTTSGKWDVKNLAKWKAVLPVSAPISVTPDTQRNGLFRALKTMREQDEEHSPSLFLDIWASRIYAVIDISKDAPVYDTKSLDKAGVEYHKFPTVSKIPPTPIEVQDFCSLVDSLLAERDAKIKAGTEPDEKRAIAVHCHYGYNRTGFFICSYLILKRGYKVQQAIDEFARAKPPGIRHEHFLDQMWLRYAGIAEEPRSDEDKAKKKKLKNHRDQFAKRIWTSEYDGTDSAAHTDNDTM